MSKIMEELFEEERAEAIKEAKFEAARNMLLEDVPIDKIASWQGLPLETVQQLAEELKTTVTN